MPAPRLTDDGRTVTLDLHGVRVDDAERLILRTAALAAERGRASLTVIHGASTSSDLYRNRTIRHALYDLLDDGALGRWVTGEVRFDGRTVLALDVLTTPDTRRLSVRDLMHRDHGTE